MIKNNIIMDVSFEILINNKEILISNDYSKNVFIKGDTVYSAKIFLEQLYKEILDSEFTPYEKEHLNYAQINDYLGELMYQTSKNNIFTVNIIIDEYEKLIYNFMKYKELINKKNLEELFDDLCKYCENEIVYSADSGRINLNIFISNEKINYNDLKALVNNEKYIDENFF